MPELRPHCLNADKGQGYCANQLDQCNNATGDHAQQ